LATLATLGQDLGFGLVAVIAAGPRKLHLSCQSFYSFFFVFFAWIFVHFFYFIIGDLFITNYTSFSFAKLKKKASNFTKQAKKCFKERE
jgi:hypothetical protein